MNSKLSVFAALALFLTVAAWAQDPQTGFPPYGSFEVDRLDGINRRNLNVNLAIPIVSSPGRGRDFNFAVVHDSLVWKKNGNAWSPVTDFGWKKDTLGKVTFFKITKLCQVGEWPDVFFETTYEYSNYVYTDVAGTAHRFNISFYSTPTTCNYPTGPTDGYATDGSGIYLDAWSAEDPDVKIPDGTIFEGNKLTDTNGNYFSQIVVSSTETHWKDTVGRIVLKIIKTGNTLVEYKVPDPSGSEQTYKLRLQNYSIKTYFQCSGVTEYTGGAYLPYELELPTPLGGPVLKYQFTYEDTPGFSGYKSARLKRITLPTGGYVEYQYPTTGNKGITCTDGTVVNLTRVINDGSTSQTWTFSRAPSGSDWVTTATAPQLPYDSAGNKSEFTFDSAGKLKTTKLYQGATTLLRTINTTWATNGTPAWSTVVLENNQQSRVATTFDDFGNLTSLNEYDWGSGGVGPLIRTTTLTYETGSAYTSRNIRDRVKTVLVSDSGGTKKAETLIFYDEATLQGTTDVPQHDYTGYPSSFTTRGNPTTIKRWISGTTYAITSLTYNDLGNVLTVADPGGHTTTLSYTDNYSDGISRNSLAYLTQITKPSPFTSQTVSFKYYYPTGQIHSTTDENGRVTSFTYQNATLRLTQTSFPDGGLVTLSYDDATRTVTVTQKRTSSENIVVTDVYNQLGLLAQRQLPGSRKIDVTYDPFGRTWKVTNPYVSQGESTYGVVETRLDALGRITTQINQDGTSATVQYAGNGVKVTDESSKQWLAQLDGLGRLTRVCEVTAGNTRSPAEACGVTGFSANGYVTTHQYDALGNVTQTVQTGQTARTASYDGLSRIATAKIIEISTTANVTYSYDLDSNLLSVTDPRGTVNFEYDELHRIKRKKHGTTVMASYSYDGTQANNAIGRLITEKDGDFPANVDKTDYTYDVMGRPLTANRTVSGSVYLVSFAYDLMGDITSINYPRTSGTRRLVEYSYKTGTGELNKVTDGTNPSAKFDYVTSASYTPHGVLQQLNLGNTVHTDLGSNKRYQLTSIFTQKGTTTVHLNLGYTLFANGQIQQVTDNLNNLKTEKYTYDELSRLLTAQRGPDASVQRLYSYDYDRYGNRWAQTLNQGSGYNTSHTFNTANNRVTTSGFTYDTSGNITDTGPSPTFTYDLESLMTAAGTSTYKVDARGRRVRKTVSGAATDYFYVGSVVISEKQGSTWTDYVFFGGQRIAKQTGSTASTATYWHTDHLGSTRVCTDSNGNSTGACDYEPFGELQPGVTCPASVTYRYAGMEFDAETGLYHTWFRQYDTTEGRWLSVDPLAASPDAPQSLNRYAYVVNDPVNLVDPLGLEGEGVPDLFTGCWVAFVDPYGEIWPVYSLPIDACLGSADFLDFGLDPDRLEDILRRFAGLQLNLAQQGTINDCQAMQRIFGAAFSLFNNTHSAVDALTRVLTERIPHSASPTSRRENVATTAVGVYTAYGPTFGDRGFHEDFRDVDPSNQVRHFTAYLNAGFHSGQDPLGPVQFLGGIQLARGDEPGDRALGFAGLRAGYLLQSGLTTPNLLLGSLPSLCQQ